VARGQNGTILFSLILLLALGLRLYDITAVPPGLTHDEANHGREALEVLAGQWQFYFPYNYGSEPLYSYTIAAMMGLLGENIFVLRLVNVLFGLAAIGVAYAWTRRAFDRSTALLTAALLAVTFWPLAGSREALRAGMFPFFLGTAVYCFWHLLLPAYTEHQALYAKRPPGNIPDSRFPIIDYRLPALIGFILGLTATFYIYLSARVAWLVFPIFLLYLAWQQPAWFKAVWRPVGAGLLVTAVLIAPLFIYLRLYPDVQPRVSMLDRPLAELQAGNWQPLAQNSVEALLSFGWPGYGDQFLAYNIPGRPVFDGITAVFFLTGIALCLWRWRQPAYLFVLLWFGVGIIPSLITGPTANTTRNIAALIPIFILPALGFIGMAEQMVKRWGMGWKRPLAILACLWLGGVAILSAADYFIRWGQSAEVRGAYQVNLVEAIRYGQEQVDPAATPLVISTVYPGPAHDYSISLVLAPNWTAPTRWVDARQALLLPAGEDGQALIPASTPPHEAFGELLRPLHRVDLRPDDLDPYFVHYALRPLPDHWLTPETPPLANFNDAVELRAARWLADETPPGDVAQLLTIWRVTDPARVGPIVPPAYTSDVALFVHVLDDVGEIVAQHDGLDAPSWSWQAGDWVLQIHPIYLPPETAVGAYEAVTGIYDKLSGVPTPRVSAQDARLDGRVRVEPLVVAGRP
jgi:4-amino-4-deoxy-L-arabinose transferase-like glycosyltransferase